MKIQKGFTLVELLVALTLGLMITATALLLFLTGQKSYSMQQGTADLQDNANFGLNFITQGVRLANLNNRKAFVNDELVSGGLVLSQNNFNSSVAEVPAQLLSASDGDNAGVNNQWRGLSNVALTTSADVLLASDQLVIQYVAQTSGRDCEGNDYTSGQIVIERYFLRTDANAETREGNALALVCDAGQYNSTNNNLTSVEVGFGGAGQILMKRVDYFRVLLGVENTIGNKRYIGISEYSALPATPPKPRIVSVSLGILARSTQAVGEDTVINPDQTFNVLDRTVRVHADGNPTGYVRQVITQEIALRNGLGARDQ
ncbi:PilW family protein [Acinetobacter faecalis]|uniref:PilW family protein n=1 Tax=Acinetobacter faecalis TaxID=2665161 RepID=UPI002A908F14|nr:PilW family protein [Acinetobacter faecalis]MDY6509780.1 PilW family protein [Acinetobacter faecalis]